MPETEFEFILPKGLVDAQGNVHCAGIMRLATAKDEVALQKNQNIQTGQAYGVLVRLSQVITRLGTLSVVTSDLLENLFVLDLAYLREFYNQVNQQNEFSVVAQCPQCSHNFKARMALSGES
jgi:ABC-type sulfate transport system permease subunit